MSAAVDTREAVAQRPLVLGRAVAFGPVEGGVEAQVAGRAFLLSDVEQYVASRFLAPIPASDVVSTSPPALLSEDLQRTIAALLDRGILEEHRAAAGVPSVFNPETLGHPAVQASVRGALARGRAVIVRDAFLPELAEEAHASLSSSTAWREQSYFQPDRPYFQYHRWAISRPLSLPPVLRAVARSLGAPETKALMRSLSGTDCSGPFDLCAAANRAGDYSLPHNDDGGLRALTYIWYVSKGWRPDWGGHLAWCPTGSMVTPEFNSLVLFRVSRSSLHFVTPVAPHAEGGRLSVSGWWHRPFAAPDNRPVATVLGGVHLSPGVYGEPTTVVGERGGVVAL